MKHENEKRHILIIEDDRHIAEGLKLNLTMQGFQVTVAEDGNVGIILWKTIAPDLIVLDIMLPGIDGWSILKSIRQEDDKIPVLILSAKNDTQDKIRGLSYGVDDYLGKPFDLDEFLLRVERLMKRGVWAREAENGRFNHQKPGSYRFGDNEIDFNAAIAICQTGKITLTDQELKLLKLFINNKGRILTRKMLLEEGWGYRDAVTTRTVDNFIVRFRKYFEPDPKNPVYFKSRRSFGYLFDDKGSESDEA